MESEEPEGTEPGGAHRAGEGSRAGGGGPTERRAGPCPPGPGVPERPGQARELVHDLLLTVEPPVDVLVLADAVLVASELVTNALRHGGGLTAFRVALVQDSVEVSVSDRSHRLPAVRQGTEGQGFGWPLVRRVARTEVTPRADGKTVRAWVALRPDAPKPQVPFGGIPAQRRTPGVPGLPGQ